MNPQTVFIGLGSNIEDPKQQISTALLALKQADNVSLIKCSHLYGSLPMGPKNQPDYVNAVCEITTTLTPEALLDLTQSIEQEHGRIRKAERWGPRTLDLDILLIDDLKMDTPRLTIPHYGMSTREFVLVPLFEIAPDMVMQDNKAIAQWVANCSLVGLKRLDLIEVNDLESTL